jgi:hypothetical protein
MACSFFTDDEFCEWQTRYVVAACWLIPNQEVTGTD